MRQDISGFMTRLDAGDIARYGASGAWANQTILDRMFGWADRDAARPAFIEGGKTVTRGEAIAQAGALAGALSAMGLKRGDVVSHQLPNWQEVAILDLAAAWLGLVINPLVPIYRESEISYVMCDCRARVVFVPHTFRRHDYLAMFQGLRGKLPDLEHVVVVRGGENLGAQGEYLSFESLLAQGRHVDRAAVSPDDVKFVLYTSGTTGRPKGVLHSHNTIESAARACIDNWNLDERDTILMPSTLTHSTGYLYGLIVPCTGGMPVVYMPVWDGAEALALCEQYGIRFIISATTFLRELTVACERRGYGLPALRYFGCGGAPVPPDTIIAAQRHLGGCMPCRIYGSTEAFTVTLGPRDATELERAASTDGFIVNCEVLIADDAGLPVPQGQDGEILVRGPQMFLGYSDPQDNLAAFDEAGYFRTGDLARTDVDGWLTITGRKKDLIIRGGENISAKEVEDALYKHPRILDASVVAMPHERLGEACSAFIILRDDPAGEPVTVDALSRFLRAAGLAVQKCPERIEIVTEFPRTSVGKVKKNLLRDEIKRLVEQEQACR